ncbi:MAG TPA: phospholipase D-like domain-containing protein [Thermodesulfobacteriota bacterium]|nr:phospholipase D-like domain-containing protein [Thermodesulfobacteriota bacterium]
MRTSAWLAVLALVLLVPLGCGTESPGPAPGGDLAATGPGALPEPATGPPADDEAELTSEEKTEEELRIEAEPLPPPLSPADEEAAAARAVTAAGSELRRLCFSPVEDCVARLLGYLQTETRGIDVAIYHLYDHRISRLLADKHRAGVRVRVIADRHAYTIKRAHAREMNFLAANGVPVLTNRHRGIVHHKLTILHGHGLVAEGSMNYTAIASRRVTGPDGRPAWNDELAFFTRNPLLLRRFQERFDRMWANVGAGQETFQVFQPFMRLPTFAESEATKPATRYEDPKPDPRPLPDAPDLRACFVPDQHCVREVLLPVVTRETRRLDILMFRATSFVFATPLIERVRAGLPVRIIFERSQYNNPTYPNMTTIIRQLWAANTRGNLELKATAHAGSMHMKAVITPDRAAWGSGNYSLSSSRRVRGLNRTYYQDEDMVLTSDPRLVSALQARFDAMWQSGDFTPFQP